MKKYTYAIPFSKKYPNLDKLLSELKESIILDILPYALLIEKEYSKYLKPPPEGVYLKNSRKPILEPNKVYYKKSNVHDLVIFGNKSYAIYPIVPISSISEVNETLLDSNYNVLLPEYVMSNKSKYLSNIPNLPVVGLSVVESYLLSLFSNNNHNTTIINYLTNEGIDLYNSGDIDIETLINDLIYQCRLFIGNDIHFIYDISFNSSNVIIDKLVDIRIYEWTLNKELKNKKQDIKFLEEEDLFY